MRKLRLSQITLNRLNIEADHAVTTTAQNNEMAPTICHGDTIHIDLGRKCIKDGKVFVISHHGLVQIKRLYCSPCGGVKIISDNMQDYPAQFLTVAQIETEEFKVLGWVWSWQKLEYW